MSVDADDALRREIQAQIEREANKPDYLVEWLGEEVRKEHAAYEARIAVLEAENARQAKAIRLLLSFMDEAATAVRNVIAALEAENARKTKVLEPFAAVLDKAKPEPGDDVSLPDSAKIGDALHTSLHPTIGHLRAARAALQGGSDADAR